MGQQQILLIVLSVILVGIAVAVGINMFNSQQQQSEVDMLATQMQNAGTAAYQFYIKPLSLGGAGKDPSNMGTGQPTWLPQFDDTTVEGSVVVAASSGNVCQITANTPADGSNKQIVVTVGTDGSVSSAITDN